MTEKKYQENEVIEIAKAYDEIGKIYYEIDDAILKKKILIEAYESKAKECIDKIPKELHQSLEKIAKLEKLLNKK